MPARFAVTACPERDLLSITLEGFFDPAGLVGFDQARHAAHQQLRCGPNCHDVLVDVRDLKLQTHDVVEAFRHMIADPATRARRLAFVTGDSAVRMQVRRLIDRPDVRCFAELHAAEAWLNEPAGGFALAG